MEEHDQFQVVAKALVRNPDGQTLFIKDPKGDWDLPGGRIHHSESVFDALKREVFEELGVECNLLSHRPELIWTGQDKFGIWRIALGFPVELLSQEFKQSEEFAESAYFTRAGIQNLNMSAQYKKLKEIL